MSDQIFDLLRKNIGKTPDRIIKNNEDGCFVFEWFIDNSHFVLEVAKDFSEIDVILFEDNKIAFRKSYIEKES